MKFSECLSLVSALLLICGGVSAQKRDLAQVEKELSEAKGKDRIMLLIEIANQEIYSDQEKSLALSREALALAKKHNQERGVGLSYRYIGLSHHHTAQYDSAIHYYLECIPFFPKPKDKGWSYFNIATVFESQGQYDSAFTYLNQAIPLFEEDNARKELAASKMIQGNIASQKGDWAAALPFFLSARKTFSEMGDLSRTGDAISETGSVYQLLGEFGRAEDAFREASVLYQQNNEPYYYAEALLDLGSLFHTQNQLDSASAYLRVSHDIAVNSKNQYVAGSALESLAEIALSRGQLENSRALLLSGISFYQKSNDQQALINALRLLAELEMKDRNFIKAQMHIKSGLAIADSLEVLGDKADLLRLQSTIHSMTGSDKEALLTFQLFHKINDSLSSVSKTERMQQLLVQFETEKKEKELIQSQALSQQRAARNTILSISLGALFLLSGLLIYHLIQKRKRDQKILQQEKDLESEKRKSTERELEFKQRELTAKALQLASKNEFLSNLEEQIIQLRSETDHQVNRSSLAIARHIRHDAINDQEWEQFTREFNSLNQGFVNRLKATHSSLTGNDLRLISLIHMNLSSKDVANSLRISLDGVKKARYRLRKKMGLSKEVSLQEYVMSLAEPVMN